jgi:bifunctional DNase/RNase
MLEVRLTAVRVDMQSNTPVVLLQELTGERSLPIFIGPPEATAIAYAVQKVEVPRPMTHDLMRDVVQALGATVTKVVVTEVHDGTYYAFIHLERNGIADRGLGATIRCDRAGGSRPKRRSSSPMT